MNCVQLEQDLALYSGGDLAGGRAAEVEAHLDGCADCRALVDELHAAQALLREGDEEVESAIAAQVRRRVMGEIGRTRSSAGVLWGRPAFGWRWVLGFGFAAAIVMAVILGWPARLEEPGPVVRLHAPAAPVWNARPVRVVRAHHRAARPRQTVRQPVLRAEAAPLMVQFVTDNPNVVIYWIVDSKSKGVSSNENN